MSCPELRVLSQLLDGELTTAEAAAVAPHVEGCATCRTRRVRLERTLAALRGAVSAPAPAADTADRPVGCLAPEQVAGWVARALTTRAQRAADAHLEGCAHCLADALAAAHMTASLDARPSLPVPAALKARVASRWGDAAEPSLTALVLRLTRAGVALVERHVVAPLLDVEARLAPLPAVRAEAAPEALSFLIRAPEAEIHATVVPAGDAVTLTLALERAGVRLAGQRVSLRQHGRAIYSARTDAAGEVHLPRLEPGAYEVSCWSINTAFRLDLLA